MDHCNGFYSISDVQLKKKQSCHIIAIAKDMSKIILDITL